MDQRVEIEIMKVMGEDTGYKSGGYGVWLYCELGEIIVFFLVFFSLTWVSGLACAYLD